VKPVNVLSQHGSWIDHFLKLAQYQTIESSVQSQICIEKLGVGLQLGSPQDHQLLYCCDTTADLFTTGATLNVKKIALYWEVGSVYYFGVDMFLRCPASGANSWPRIACTFV